ncbi:MAG: guanine permease [Candidatus Aminicenantes bacterium RBG_16_63_16]|nr:MAG: guanine permease [Candidatus Aminicenantes bacterium RBG_16_63_16]
MAPTRLADGLFKLREKGTTPKIEILGGATTFITMAYIIVVNPAILSFAGLPPGPSTVATILAAAFGSILMGLYANRPIAVAPYMGENAFIAFGLAAMGIAWQQRLGSVFISGLVFMIITLLKVRSWLANSISPSLKHSFAVGIGMFLAFIGLYETGIVTSSVAGMPAGALVRTGASVLSAPDVPVKIGDLRSPQVLLAVLGFLLISFFLHRRIRGGILLGIAATAVLGYAFGLGESPSAVAALPFTGKYSLGAIAFKLDIAGVLKVSFLPILITLFLMSFLDTLGTLVGVGAAGKMLDEKGNFPDIERPMMADAASCVFSALVGTSTSGAYIESATGIREGARTGLAAVTTGVLFLVSLFFIPIIEPLQHLRYAYGPALIAVGVLMMSSAVKIDFTDLTELIPAFATIVMMIFTYNIANGLTAGLVLYPVFKIAAGRAREVNAGSVVLGLLCLVYYVFGLPH